MSRLPALLPLCAAAAATLLAACSSPVLEKNAQGWRENECMQILDTPRRERCLREARQ